MTSIVEELQWAATGSDADVATLLRKALVVAAKLNLAAFKSWVELELNGYADVDVELPPYRKSIGHIAVFSPVRGYVPMVIGDGQLADLITAYRCSLPVGLIQEYLQGTDRSIYFPLPNEIEVLLMRGYPPGAGIPQLEVSRGAFVLVLDAVRNQILQWSLQLEADGIVGEGLSFSAKEKQIAASRESELRPTVTINNVNGNSISDAMIQQSSDNSTQGG